MKKDYRPETLALYAGYEPADNMQARGVPIHATTSYVFESAKDAGDIFALKKPGYIYSRLGNPTCAVLEERLAAYHGGSAAVAFASGSAANAMLAMTLGGPGRNIVASPNLYGGTVTLLTHVLKKWGLTTRFVDLNDQAALEKAIDENTVMVFGEMVGNPSCRIIDIEPIAATAHKFGLPLVIDNTSTPPPIINPFDYGADLLTYSLTKMVAGHGTHLGGLVIEMGDFDWSRGRFPDIDGPDASYDGLNFWRTFGEPSFKDGQSQVICAKLRTGLLRDLGATLSPFGAHEILLGLETLPLRAARHLDNAYETALFLKSHPKVAWVNYAGLEDHPNYGLSLKYFNNGRPSAVFGFGVKGGYEASVRFINNLKLFSHLANILDARTLVIHPASTTHQQLTSEERAAGGVPDDLIRLSVGLENIDDIKEIIDEALRA